MSVPPGEHADADLSRTLSHDEQDGLAAKIAASPAFEQVTLLVISVNAVWIAVDVDGNFEPSLVTAKPQFVIMENFFCVYFLVEILIRFLAVSVKKQLLQDAWFVFDALLVVFMVLETWIITIIAAAGGMQGNSPLGNMAILRLLRLLRLTKLARLMRAMPELMVLLRGMANAARSVLVTLFLLVVIVYVFSVALVQILEGAEIEDKDKGKFDTVPAMMYTLIVDGILPDYSPFLRAVERVGWFPTAIALSFVVIATFTVMNMLVGILCEVACRVSQLSREQMEYQVVQNKLHALTSSIDVNGDGLISKEEFLDIVGNKEAARAMKSLGVDLASMKEAADGIFYVDPQACDADGEPLERKLHFNEFMEVVGSMRPMNAVTVKDVVTLRKFIHSRVCEIEDKMADRLSQQPSKREPSASAVSAVSSVASDVPLILDSPESTTKILEDSAAPQMELFDAHADPKPASRKEVDELRQQVQSLQGIAERLMDSQVQLSGSIQALSAKVSFMFQELSKDHTVVRQPRASPEKSPGSFDVFSARSPHKGVGDLGKLPDKTEQSGRVEVSAVSQLKM